MEDLQLAQSRVDKETYLWSTMAGIIGFILINFFIISRIRYSDLEMFSVGIPISIFLHLLIGVIVGLISKTRIKTKALINVLVLSPLIVLNGILVLFGIFSYLLGSLLAFIFYKFSKIWRIIIGSIFLTAITLLISIGLPEISVDASVRVEITPKKDSYKLGEAIIAKTTLANYSLMPLRIELYEVVPQIFLYQKAPEVWFDYNSEQPFQYPGRIEEPEKLYLAPFQAKTYETKLTLINNKASFDYSGTSNNHDIIVKPGENTIQALFSRFDGDDIKVNIDSQNFNQVVIPCENFVEEKRKETCQRKIGTEQYVNKYFKYSFNNPQSLKIFQEASSDNQYETLLGTKGKDSNKFLILINAHKNTEKLTAEGWAKKMYGDNRENLFLPNYHIEKIASEPVITYSLAENQGRDFGYSLVFTKAGHPYIFEVKVFYDKNDEKLLSDFNKIVETFSF